MNGSISAEHGIGQMKRAYVDRPPNVEAIMKEMKAIFDPQSILNPNKVFND